MNVTNTRVGCVNECGRLRGLDYDTRGTSVMEARMEGALLQKFLSKVLFAAGGAMYF